MSILHISNSDNISSLRNQSSDSVFITDNSIEIQKKRELVLRFLLDNIEHDAEE